MVFWYEVTRNSSFCELQFAKVLDLNISLLFHPVSETIHME